MEEGLRAKTQDSIRIGAVCADTEAEGPSRRFAVWVQGCAIRCRDCCNPHLFDADAGRLVPIEDLCAALDAAAPFVEGVTLLGGEPFDQAGALAHFAEHARRRDLGVITFTGYTYESLRVSGEPGASSLIAATDLLVDGPFLADRPDAKRRWIGSTNQRLHHLTDRYPLGLELPPPGQPPERLVELRIDPSGTVQQSGWPAIGDRLLFRRAKSCQ